MPRITNAQRLLERQHRLMPDGMPRYIRCYDNEGKTADRYTIVFTSRYKKSNHGSCLYIGCSSKPFHPQVIGMHCEPPIVIDRPGYSHLGKKIAFDKLPPDVRKLVTSFYKKIWSV